MEIDYKPKHPAFSGSLKLKAPSYKERIGLAKELNFKVENVEGTLVADNKNSQFDVALKLLEIVDKHVISMELTHTESGQVFKSIEDLDYTEEGSSLVDEIGTALMRGVKLGKA